MLVHSWHCLNCNEVQRALNTVCLGLKLCDGNYSCYVLIIYRFRLLKGCDSADGKGSACHVQPNGILSRAMSNQVSFSSGAVGLVPAMSKEAKTLTSAHRLSAVSLV